MLKTQLLACVIQKRSSILANVSATLDSSEGVFSEDRNVKTALVVCITSDRGLCGAFNNYSIKITKTAVEAYEENGVKVQVLPLGKKAVEAFPSSEGRMPNGFEPVQIFSELNFNDSSDVADFIMNGFVSGDWDSGNVAKN